VLFLSIRGKFREGVPPSAKSGQEGKNAVQFRVLQDGKVPEEFLKLIFNSEDNELDEVSLQAIRKAAPFNHLPDKFSKPYIELRAIFFTMPPFRRRSEDVTMLGAFSGNPTSGVDGLWAGAFVSLLPRGYTGSSSRSRRDSMRIPRLLYSGQKPRQSQKSGPPPSKTDDSIQQP